MQLFICYISCFSYSCLAEKPNIFRWMQPWQARFLWGELDYSIFGKCRQRRKSHYKRSELEPWRGVSLLTKIFYFNSCTERKQIYKSTFLQFTARNVSYHFKFIINISKILFFSIQKILFFILYQKNRFKPLS